MERKKEKLEIEIDRQVQVVRLAYRPYDERGGEKGTAVVVKK